MPWVFLITFLAKDHIHSPQTLLGASSLGSWRQPVTVEARITVPYMELRSVCSQSKSMKLISILHHTRCPLVPTFYSRAGRVKALSGGGGYLFQPQMRSDVANFLRLLVFDFVPQVIRNSLFWQLITEMTIAQLPARGIPIINCSFNNTTLLPNSECFDLFFFPENNYKTNSCGVTM